MIQIAASDIKGLRVAHVCRAVAGLSPPAPMDNRRALVSREESTGEERWGASHGHAPRVPHTVHLPASRGLTPSFRHVQQACMQAVRRCQVACAPARACRVRRDVCGRRLPPGALLHPGRHAALSYKSATSLRLASVSPSMERCVIARLVWPASSCTSRRLPPTCDTRRTRHKGAAPGMRRTAVHFQRRREPMKP